MKTRLALRTGGLLAVAATVTLLACGGDDSSIGSSGTGTSGTATTGTGTTGTSGTATTGTGTTGTGTTGTGTTGTATGTSGTTTGTATTGTSGTATTGTSGTATTGTSGTATTGTSGTATEPDAGHADSGAAGATFTAVYALFNPTCTGCHKATTPTGSLDMSTKMAAYTNLVGVPAAGASCAGMGTRVVPNSAATSLLYEKLAAKAAGGPAAPCGAAMPKTGTALTAAQLMTVQSWINAGALND